MALAAAVVVGATRVALGAHTLADVLVGGGLGVVGSVALVRAAGARPAGLATPRLALLLILVLAVLLHGQHLDLEAFIRGLARRGAAARLCGR